MPSRKTVLIVEDSPVNRKFLAKLLSPEYEILEAENGQEGLDLLRLHSAVISGVLLDLNMPVLDGFGFLEAVADKTEYKSIPVIVVTENTVLEAEHRALNLGAWDFVTKPYDGEILKFRLRNAIERSQLFALSQLKYLAEYDPLTGIYNQRKFFQATREMLLADPAEQYVFVRIDIDRFQLVNSFFGQDEGDKLLCHLANSLKIEDGGQPYIYGRMEADVFAACFTYRTREAVLQKLEQFKEQIRAYNRDIDIVPVFGVYFLEDTSMPVDELLDRAALAAKSRKGNHVDTIGIHCPEMHRKLEQEQQVVKEMSAALAENQFILYLQPKYALEDNTPSGAEALVRWNHPTKGVIFPDAFIPVFEKNGFISKLDLYVWESVCRLLQKWMRSGISPAPISVNISRVDLYNPKIVEMLSELVKKYDVPPELLQLELTESVYMDNPQMMQQIVDQMHSAGFTVMMDDFGSGFSSLGVLKDINVDILKIDMRFFENTKILGRGENIIAAVIRMSKWLNIPTVAEGVEQREQVEFLNSVGCDYVQGFSFSKPLPVEVYEQQALQKRQAESVRPLAQPDISLDKLWSSEPEMKLLFSDATQAYGIFECDGRSMEILRVNKAFNKLFGCSGEAVYTAFADTVLGEDYPRVVSAAARCAQTQSPESCVYRRNYAEGEIRWIEMRLQYVRRVGGKDILLGSLSDSIAQKETEQKYLSTLFRISDEKRFTMERAVTLPDLQLLLSFMESIFDTVRLVDPEKAALVGITESGQLEYKPYTCFQIWKRDGCCDPCISLRAAEGCCQTSKYEHFENDVFYVVSNPVLVFDGEGERQLVVELISHVSNKTAMNRTTGKSIDQLIEETRLKIYTDELTGAYNRRYLNEFLFLQTDVAVRLALVMLDLRSFKQINDRMGHAAGDEVLRQVTKKLAGVLRHSDSVVRYGGDEFVVTLTHCTEEQAQAAIGRMRKAVETIPCACVGTGFVQADFGYAYLENFERKPEVLLSLLRTADQAMYVEKARAKNRSAGRNRC
ncbi:EAL domain-containing protein [Oscillibacter sp.]|uniref:EAL domain-containing protein n=1 Tax=Oscillibacter sp. TaxID=1945593 RepID=UPI002606D740|nr:EAL domain-containing protein [Oscillibacter sp.]MDD3347811.1 EAL domain-containing protein [Oscillibacter sp.]